MCDDINLEKILIRNSNHMSLTFFTLPAQPFPTHKLHNELIEIGNNVRNQTNETRSFSARKKKKEKKKLGTRRKKRNKHVIFDKKKKTKI